MMRERFGNGNAVFVVSWVGTGLAVHWSQGNPGARAMSNIASMSINPLFLRHDLMIELGRLEMAIDSARSETQPEAALGPLETRFAKINEALSKLPA
jgi:hypothetical protein